MHFAVFDRAGLVRLQVFDLGRAQHDEERVLVTFDFGPLVRRKRVFDGELVEAELLLYLPKESLIGLVQANPHERVRAFEDVTDVVERDLADSAAV